MTRTETLTRLLAESGLPSTTPRQRLRGVPETARRLHRALLHEFVKAGAPPEMPVVFARLHLDEEHGRRQLAVLAAADLVALDSDGNLAGAFPFSAVPTRQPGGPRRRPDRVGDVAIDALGIPPCSAGRAR
jgi:hypothetical protein